VKRLLVASMLAAALLAQARPAFATTSSTGNGQIQWTTSPAASLAIVTQYSAAFAQGNAAPSLLPSPAAACTGPASETNFMISFGSFTPLRNAPIACLYKNALAISVTTNDSNGFTVNEYLDTTPVAGIGVCAFPNGGAAFPLAATASATTSARGVAPAPGTFTANVLTACAAGGAIVPPGTGGASSAGANPGNPGAPGLEFYSPSTAQLAFVTQATTGSNVAVFGGEDIQLNVAPGQTSTAALATLYLTVQLIPN
jgi:hypothetical protein